MTKYKILYAEDDETLAFLTQDNLEQNNYEVIHCANGEIAIEAFKNETFDICIFDIAGTNATMAVIAGENESATIGLGTNNSSSVSGAVKTAIMEKIPIVTPSKESNVRNLLLRKAFMAKPKLSFNKRK